MKVYECDRCGAYVEQRALELLRMPYRGIWRIGRRGHLCPECAEGFGRWWVAGKRTRDERKEEVSGR